MWAIGADGITESFKVGCLSSLCENYSPLIAIPVALCHLFHVPGDRGPVPAIYLRLLPSDHDLKA